MESQCLEDVTNFRKMKNHSIFAFLVQCAIYICGTNIYSNIRSFEIKKCFVAETLKAMVEPFDGNLVTKL
jgi:hypothetical protein